MKITAPKLAIVLGIPVRTCQDAIANARVKNTQGKGYDRNEATRAVVKHYREAAERIDSQGANDRARKIKAEADMAEVDRGKKVGEMCLMSDYENNLKDAIALGVSNISRLACLTTTQKEKVFAALRDIKMPPLPET